MSLSWFLFFKSPRLRSSGNPQTIHQELEGFLEGYTAHVKQRLKTQTLVQKDTVSSISLLKTNRKTSCGPVVGARTHCNTGWKSLLVEASRSMRGVSASHSGTEHRRNDMCLLRRNHSAGLCRVVSKGGSGVFQSVAGFLDWGCREKELSQREQVLFQLEYIHDGIVQLSEHHKVDGKAGGTVLGGRIAREPRQSVVLLQNKP